MFASLCAGVGGLLSACRESSIVWLSLPGFSEVFDCFHLCRLDHLFFSDLLLKLTFWELELPRVVFSKQAFFILDPRCFSSALIVDRSLCCGRT